jgi:hypothetical protein
LSSDDDLKINNMVVAPDNMDSDESADECLSTDGEETDPDSPY